MAPPTGEANALLSEADPGSTIQMIVTFKRPRSRPHSHQAKQPIRTLLHFPNSLFEIRQQRVAPDCWPATSHGVYDSFNGSLTIA